MENVQAFMRDFVMRGQHPGDRALTRNRYDTAKMAEANDIATGPGRYVLGVPHFYAAASWAPNPTIIGQRWGAAHDMTSTKTDVESDLWNIDRPTTRSACGAQWNPTTAPARNLTSMPEIDFPQVHNRYSNPPCTMRGTGPNRWSWLGQDPQAGVMMPFEWSVDTRYAAKDDTAPRLTKALAPQPCAHIGADQGHPAARIPGPRDAPDFTNVLAADSVGVGPVRFTPTGAPARDTAPHPLAPAGPGYVEMNRAATGVIAPPPRAW